MTTTIEQARKAVALRAKLDAVDKELSATPRSDGTSVPLVYWQGNSNSQTNVRLSSAEVEAFMTVRHNRLKAERLMILAEAAEAGLVIEDEPQSLTRSEEA